MNSWLSTCRDHSHNTRLIPDIDLLGTDRHGNFGRRWRTSSSWCFSIPADTLYLKFYSKSNVMWDEGTVSYSLQIHCRKSLGKFHDLYHWTYFYHFFNNPATTGFFYFLPLHINIFNNKVQKLVFSCSSDAVIGDL